MRRVSWGAAVVAAWLVVAPAARGQIAVVSVRSYDALEADLKYLAPLAGLEELAKQAQAPLRAATGGKGLDGVDTTKPFGAYVLWPAGTEALKAWDFPAIGFVPVADEARLLALLERAGLKVGKPDGAVRVLKAPNGTELALRFAGGHAHVAFKPAWLRGELPAAERLRPAGGRKALLLARLFPERFPPEYKLLIEQAIKPLREGIGPLADLSLGRDEKRDGETVEQFRQRVAFKKQLKLIPDGLSATATAFVENTRTLSLEVGVDQQGHTLAVELALVPRPKSAIAGFAAYAAGSRCSFDYLARGADLSVRAHFPGFGDEEAAGLSRQVARQIVSDGLVDPRQRPVVEGLVGILIPTLATDGLDGGFAMYSGGSALTFGAKVRGGRRLDHLVRDVIRDLPLAERKKLPTPEWNHARHGPARIHRLPNLEGIEAFLAFRDDAVFFGAPLDSVRRALDGLGTSTRVATPLVRVEARGTIFVDEKEFAELKKKFPDADRERNWLHATLRGGDDLRLRLEVYTRAMPTLRDLFP